VNVIAGEELNSNKGLADCFIRVLKLVSTGERGRNNFY